MLTYPPAKLKPLLIALLMGNAAAMAAEKPATRFDAITVTTTRSKQKLSAVPSTVSVHDERQIDQQNIKNIQDLIRYEPGVSVSGGNSRFGLSGFTIRGIGGNRVLTQVDGVNVADSFAFGGFLNARRDYVDLDTVKQVEIIRGPASSLYGSDAIGGAVSFITKDAGDYLEAGDDMYLRLKTGYDGADDSWLRSGTVAARYANMDALMHLGRRTGHASASHGKHGGSGAQRTKTNPQDYTRDNLLTKLGWELSEQQRLQLTYEKFADDTDSKVMSNYGTSSFGAITHSQDAKDSVDRERYSLAHTLTFDSVFADRINSQLTYQDSKTRQRTYESRFAAGQAQSRVRDSDYQEKLWAFNSMLNKTFVLGSSQHQLTYGIDIKRTKSSDLRVGSDTLLSSGQVNPVKPTSDFPDPTTSEYALFIQDQIQLGRWTLLPGLRYDYYKMEPHVTGNYLNSNAVDNNPSNYRDSTVSPKLGITFQVDEQHSVYGQYAAGYRAPQAVEIFGEFENPGMYRTLSNTNLKAETSDSFELGLRGRYSIGNFSAALFYNQYDDFIEQVSRPSTKPGYPFGEFQYINKDRVNIRGAEVKGELFLDTLGLADGWSTLGHIAYARGKDESSGEALNSIDPLKGVFSLAYNQPNGQFGGDLSWTLVAAKKRIDKTQTNNQYATSGYGTLDLNGWWHIDEHFSVNAGLFNLTDKRYWNWNNVQGLSSTDQGLARASQPGRHAAINLVWEL
ncbi:MAG TPA: TonB-dependent hemoglobin/transferrin/lactoferrin family receptor [Thiopseudomonas sp.]|nr:TonB-dependent hemoglobin/transferrin/lactoferrin family receptor [Thiopseudomonas sp.]